jgi:hypothetical protein
VVSNVDPQHEKPSPPPKSAEHSRRNRFVIWPVFELEDREAAHRAFDALADQARKAKERGTE